MKRIDAVLALAVLQILLSSGLTGSAAQALPELKSQTSSGSDSSTGWDKQAAAKYLDDRMDLWFEKARKLRTGQGETTCVSCHVTVPYSLARPVIRKALGEGKPTPQETKLLDETVSRVNTYASHEPIDKNKPEPSRGTESVLNLFIVASADACQNNRSPSEATRKALAELWKEQRADGAWNWLDTTMEPYESADSAYYGAALAAIALGTIPAYPSQVESGESDHIVRLRHFLKGSYADQNLYNKTWMLLASLYLDGLLEADLKNALTTELERRQNPDGGWSLQRLGPWRWSRTSPPFEPRGKPDASLLSRSDGYATGFIAYTLRRAGAPGDHIAVKRAQDWLKGNQAECEIGQNHWKCWRTFSLNYDHEHDGENGEPWRRMFMSDAATAFAALALLPP